MENKSELKTEPENHPQGTGRAVTPQSNIPVSILIVDDNHAKLTALAAALEGMDIEIITATSGMDALRHLLVQDFAMVLLDVNMPIMDGFETAVMIRCRPKSKHLPILFITAERLTDDARLQGYEIGAVDYILSPVLPQILRAKVSVFADLHRLREQSYRYSEVLLGKNEEIAHQNLMLEEANRLKSEFLVNHNRILEEQVKARTIELQENEEKFRTAIDTVLDAFIIIEGEHGCITCWNSAAEAMFGYSKQEMIGRTLHDLLLPPRFREAAQSGLEHFATTGEGAALNNIQELAALRKDESEFPIELSLSAMQLNDKWHAIGIVRDITERKRVESQLNEQLDELRRWYEATLGRELHSIELKHEVNELLKQAGQPPRYLSAEME